MIKRAKLIFVALAAARLAVTPALVQSFDPDEGTGNVLPLSSQSVATEIAPHHPTAHATRRTGMDSYAMEPRSAPRARMPVGSDDPALNGGGSIGYNELLQQEGN